MQTTPAEIDWAQIAEHTKNDVEEAFIKLRNIISSHDPIELISRVAVLILTSHPDKPKDSGGPQQSETNLEYLISFVTAHPVSQSREAPSADTVQRTIEILTIIQMAASWHYKFKRRAKEPPQSAIEDIADSFRMDKLHVRGDGYWSHLKQTICDLLRPHDAKLKDALGFTALDYLSFMERSEDELNRRLLVEAATHLDPFMKLYRPWLRDGDVGDHLDEEGWSQYVAKHETEVTEAKAKFDAFGSSEAFVFRPQSEAETLILKALSCDIGTNSSFHGAKPEHAFWPLTPSATDSFPIVHREGTFYGFNLSKLSREAYTLIGDLLREVDTHYWTNAFIKQRDAYLEAEAAKLIQQALPSSRVLKSVFYPFGENQTAEADIVVLCDDILIIVECKAARVNPATKRGANKKIVSDLKGTIVGAFDQAERFVRELSTRGLMELTPKHQAKTSISASSFERVFSINVTLDLISSAATVLWKLNEVGITSDIGKCWSVSLNDLRVIVDILDQPALFLHYLVRRLDINILRNVEARDELDYLMHYVKQGLFFREANAPAAGENVMLAGFTEELDQYYRKLEGISDKGAKPCVTIGKRTQKLLSKLQSAKPEHWVSGCVELLEFDTPTREELLGKQSEHLKQLQHPRSGYALSFAANLESQTALALVTSKDPQRAREVVIGRCTEHCRQHNLSVLWCLLQGVPISDSEVTILRVTPETEVSDNTSRLLKQLDIQVTENRRT